MAGSFRFGSPRLRAECLIVGAGGMVHKYAIQLATRTGVHVIHTTSPRGIEVVRAEDADQIIEHTTTDALGTSTVRWMCS